MVLNYSNIPFPLPWGDILGFHWGNWDHKLADSNCWNIDLSTNYNSTMHLFESDNLGSGELGEKGCMCKKKMVENHWIRQLHKI